MARQQVTKSPVTFATTKSNMTAKSSSKPRALTGPTDEQIRARAYEIFLRRKGGPGDAHSDWVQAERELREALSR
jgi:hypothetical protein